MPDSLDLYVSSAGNDAWSGRYPDPTVDVGDGPVATLEAARDALRAASFRGGRRRDGAAAADGPYQRDAAFELGAQDGGSVGEPVVYRAFRGDEVRLIGGRAVTGFQPISVSGATDVAWQRLSPAARGRSACAHRASETTAPSIPWASAAGAADRSRGVPPGHDLGALPDHSFANVASALTCPVEAVPTTSSGTPAASTPTAFSVLRRPPARVARTGRGARTRPLDLRLTRLLPAHQCIDLRRAPDHHRPARRPRLYDRGGFEPTGNVIVDKARYGGRWVLTLRDVRSAPAAGQRGLFGVAPGVVDEPNGDLRPATGSLASEAGLPAIPVPPHRSCRSHRFECIIVGSAEHGIGRWD